MSKSIVTATTLWMTAPLALFAASPDALSPSPVILSEVLVTAPPASLRTSPSSTATLVPADASEIPLSMEVIPQALLESRHVTSVYDSLEQVSGVFTGGKSSFTVSAGRPTIRGFGGNDVLLDGLALPARMPIFLDAAAFSDIEVFKGPLNGALGGQSGLQGSGGGINLVAKKPEEQGKAMLMTVMVETYAVLALLISFLLVNGVKIG